MHPLLNIAVRAARRAGDIIVRSLARLESLEVTAKGRNDFVTEVDHAAEREIIDIIRQPLSRTTPSSPRKAAPAASSDTVWIIDPLDGTTNFLHGFPVFAVSIACQVQRPARASRVVYDPMRQELFTAIARRRRAARKPPHARQQAARRSKAR